MFNRILFFFFFLIGMVFLAACAAGPERAVPGPGEGYNCANPVATASGQVGGSIDKEGNTCLWKGIPYAAPPVGDLRWKAPEPVRPWGGVRDATRWGNACAQLGMYKFNNHVSAPYSEDCLNLNIWRPRTPGTFPVMVFIHGGGFVLGAAATPMYFGDRLAANGNVIVISINYRLDAFGFLALEELAREDPNHSTGNYGVMDQVAALKWVRDNIAGFGGDPNNVTIFGQSAGGFSVCTLLATPLARGLFQRAIIESGGCEQAGPLEQGFETGRWAARELGCAENNLACLRGKSTGQVLKKLALPFQESFKGKGFRFMIHQDNYVLSGSALSYLRSGNFNNVPLLLGSTRDEFQVWDLLGGKNLKNSEAYAAKVRAVYGPDTEAILKLYPAEDYASPGLAYAGIISDRSIICPMFSAARAASQHQKAVYFYRIDYDETRFRRAIGAMHGAELPFVFQSFDRWPMNFLFSSGDRARAMHLSRIVQNYWAQFARTGDPNPAGRVTWPPFTPDHPETIVFDREINWAGTGKREKCLFWEQFSRTHPSIFAPGQI
ncbi:MAG: carboxylesterase family protein [bacterium]|nr:carboxylesterase family protein [bacterium]